MREIKYERIRCCIIFSETFKKRFSPTIVSKNKYFQLAFIKVLRDYIPNHISYFVLPLNIYSHRFLSHLTQNCSQELRDLNSKVHFVYLPVLISLLDIQTSHRSYFLLCHHYRAAALNLVLSLHSQRMLQRAYLLACSPCCTVIEECSWDCDAHSRQFMSNDSS